MTDSNAPASYDAAVTELQTLMTRMQSGEMGIDELTSGVQRASELLAFCQQRLQTTETEVQAALERLGLHNEEG